MKEIENPFPVGGYYGEALFCDREDETSQLARNAKNGINTTLVSLRRMGKTGLIYHAFNSLKKSRKTITIYTDIYATEDLKGFTNQLASGILAAFPEKHSAGKKFLQLLKSLRPVFSFDSLSGAPEISFDFSQPKQFEISLSGLFSFLEEHNTRVIVAIDEFQQINNYPEKNTEALLRTLIQPLKNVQFIFSGSVRHTLQDIFNNSKRPFFSSAQLLYLKPIPKEKYTPFIHHIFEGHKRSVTNEALQFIAGWSRLHTYYTQAICNRLFATGIQHIKLETVQHECAKLLNENEAVYFQYRSLLTPAQWSLLTAIAKEDKLFQPTSHTFVAKHQLSSASIQRALETLLSKEMIYTERSELPEEKEINETYYRVYDTFFSRWLENY